MIFRYLFLSFCISASTLTFGQKITSTSLGSPEVIYQENGVTISSKLVECNNSSRNEIMNFKMLSIQNANNTPVSIKVKHEFYYDGECRTCPNDEYNFTYTLDANETKESNCYQDINPRLAVFSSMKDGYIKEKLTDIKLIVVRLN